MNGDRMNEVLLLCGIYTYLSIDEESDSIARIVG